jgi:hypothetical protein
VGSFSVSETREEVDYYEEFLAEREELLRHKWHMSEREGRDVGFEVALTDWASHHRELWCTERKGNRQG